MIKSNLKWIAAALAIACWLPSHFAFANSLINGSFEDPTAGWSVTGMQRLPSKTDIYSVVHWPTDGQWMMGISISPTSPDSLYGTLSQSFVFPASATTITFDRNLIDPSFGTDPLRAMSVWTTLTGAGNITDMEIAPMPSRANQWEPVTLYLSGVPGEKYILQIGIARNRTVCIAMVGFPCPPSYVGYGTVLIDNVVVAEAVAPPPSNVPPAVANLSLTTIQNNSVTWTPRVNDANGDPLACTIRYPASNGVATVAPDCSSGTYTPNPGFVGNDSFTYRAKDQALLSNLGNVSVTVGPAAPTLTGFWPGFVEPGSVVFVFGSNFIPRATQVAVNGVDAPLMQVLNDTLLIFVLPSGTTAGPITVTTAAGSATSSADFGIPLSGLQLTGIWPGQAKIGSFVFVFGSGFDPAAGKTEVSINGLACPIVQVLDPALLIFLLPSGAISGPVTVNVNGQTATSNTALTILP